MSHESTHPARFKKDNAGNSVEASELQVPHGVIVSKVAVYGFLSPSAIGSHVTFPARFKANNQPNWAAILTA